MVGDAMRTLIGRQTEPETRPPVTLEEIARYAYAVDDVRPAYLDSEAARLGAHGGIVAPPLFTGFTGFRPTPLAGLRPDGLPAATDDPLQVRVPGAQSRFTGTDVELYHPIRPGDVLTRRSRIVSINEKQGRSGTMVFMVRETTITNQRDERVMIDRTTTATVPQPDGPRAAPRWDLELEPSPSAEAGAAPPPPWTPGPTWDDVAVGDTLPDVPRLITAAQVFLYSMIRSNSHRIHYDRAYAEREGLPERVAQGDLLEDMLCQTATRWMGRSGVLTRYSGENRAPGFIGETIIHRGRVTRTWRDEAGTGLVELELWSEGSKNRVCLQGSATVALPRRVA